MTGNYWITDIVATANNRCEVHCVRDVLADNRTEIMSTSAFIEYGHNTFDAGDSSPRVPDSRQTISETPSMHVTTADVFGGRINNVGTYILQVVGANNGVRTYAVNQTNLHNLIQSLNNNIASDLADIFNLGLPADETLNELLSFNYKNSLLQDSAIGAIQSCHWVPVYVTGGTSETIYLGDWSTGVTGQALIDNTVITETTLISIPWQVNDWRRKNSQIVLYIPFIGTVPIPVDQCIDAANLSVTWSFEAFSGDMAITVSAGNLVIYTGSSNISAPYAIGTSRVSNSGYASGMISQIGGGLQMAGGIIDATAGAVGTVLSAGTLGGVSSGVSSMVSGAQNMFGGYMQMIEPTITSTGLTGGLASLGQSLTAKLTLLYYPALDDAGFSGLYGHPVMKIATPVAGFCKTRGFSLASSDRMGDVTLVNAAMDGGVFIE